MMHKKIGGNPKPKKTKKQKKYIYFGRLGRGRIRKGLMAIRKVGGKAKKVSRKGVEFLAE